MSPVLDTSGLYRYNRGPLNQCDANLLRGEQQWEQLLSMGGLKTVCCPRGRRKYSSPPWITMPAEGRKYQPVGILPVFGNFTGTNTAVVQMTVDTGYDGVITDIVCEITAPGATGFVEGSGDIVWRLQSNLRWMRDLGNVKVTMGSLTSPGVVPRGGLRIYSRELITLYVNLPVASSGIINSNANIICSFRGWMYPR
jgi:hypothetical protein